jgi:hypothetical protein
MSIELPPDVVDRLARYVPRENLVGMRAVTGRPWRWLPAVLNTGAMTFGDHVVFRAGRYRIDSPRGLALIAHESLHIGQYREMGHFRFAWRYARGLFASRFDHDRHPMEAAAVVKQAEVRRALENE